jgi:hypothetical protein
MSALNVHAPVLTSPPHAGNIACHPEGEPLGVHHR